MASERPRSNGLSMSNAAGLRPSHNGLPRGHAAGAMNVFPATVVRGVSAASTSPAAAAVCGAGEVV